MDYTTKENILALLSNIKDPEIPAVDIIEMGILRDVSILKDEIVVSITPTYSGCPAMRQIEDDIENLLNKNGYNNIKIKTVLSPVWTTDWMSEETKRKLKEFGIAPPGKVIESPLLTVFTPIAAIKCPYCNSDNTVKKAEFSSTACKSLHFCKDCLQPFEHFKCH